MSIPLISSPLPIPLLPINFWIRRGIWRRRITVIRHSPRKRSVLTGVVNIFPKLKALPNENENLQIKGGFLNFVSVPKERFEILNAT